MLALLAQFAPENRLSHAGSTFWVLAITLGLLGMPFAIALTRERAARRCAAGLRETLDGRLGPLEPGMCVLSGIIEADDGPGPVVKVELRQSLKLEYHKSRTYRRWNETSRRVDARPFYLRLDDGRSVRVEPGTRAFVVDALDGVLPVSDELRARTAEVSVGERVFVLGSLTPGFDPRAHVDGGYRGDRAKALVLRPPPPGSMVISTEVPTERFLRREGFHGSWAVGYAIALLLVHLTGFRTFDVLSLTGTPVLAVVTERTREWEATKHGGHFRHFVVAQLESEGDRRLTIRDEVSAESEDELAVGRRGIFTVSSLSANVAQVGARPGISQLSLILSILLGVTLAVAYRSSTVQTLPWYDRRPLSEYENPPSR